MSHMKLSVVIPVYNEVVTLPSVLYLVVKALPEAQKEIIIVDDGSTDGTREWLSKTFSQSMDKLCVVSISDKQELTVLNDIENPEQLVDYHSWVTINVILHDRNRGKGAALRTAFENTTGDVIIIQDADLEYDPKDWSQMWQLLQGEKADVVYGSRFYGNPHRVLYFHHLLGNYVISNFINLVCNMTLSDIEVCYKMFRKEVLEDINLICNDFGFEVEFTVKVVTSARRWRIYEVGISYYGRTYSEGKKINWKDGLKALWYIIRFRLTA